MEERIPHCYMIVFAECQEGYVAIRHFNMILNRGIMKLMHGVIVGAVPSYFRFNDLLTT